MIALAELRDLECIVGFGGFFQESKGNCEFSETGTALAREFEFIDMSYGHIHCICRTRVQFDILPIEHVWGSIRGIMHLD